MASNEDSYSAWIRFRDGRIEWAGKPGDKGFCEMLSRSYNERDGGTTLYQVGVAGGKLSLRYENPREPLRDQKHHPDCIATHRVDTTRMGEISGVPIEDLETILKRVKEAVGTHK